MSEVWLAHDLELDRPVALKLLAPTAETARFEREARAVAGLADINITRLYDFGRADTRPYMVFEYLSGGTLEEQLAEQGRLADDDTLRIARDIASGLAHAHAQHVVHRDLKPANVLFDTEGRAKLADFGIARLTWGADTLTEPGTVLGTAAYISPEQAAGLAATAASDVYSFGVILHRMLTGRLPFESVDRLELVRLHRDAERPPLTTFREDAPPALAAAVETMLAKDPARRPPDGAAVLALLDTPDAASAATTRIVPPPAQRRRRRLPVLAVVPVALLALAGGALAWELTRSTDAGTPAATTHLRSRTSRAPNRPVTTRPVVPPTTTSPTTTSSTTTRRATTTRPTTSATTTARTATSTASTSTVPSTTAAPTTQATTPTTTAATTSTLTPTTTTAPATTTEPPTTTLATTTTAATTTAVP